MSATENLNDPERDNEPDLLRLRAEARAALMDADGPHGCFVELVPVRRDNDGRLLPPVCDADRATVQIPGGPDRHYAREPGETLEDFKHRLIRGGPGLGTFQIILREDPPSS